MKQQKHYLVFGVIAILGMTLISGCVRQEIQPEFVRSCQSEDIETNPDIEYLLSTTKIELDDSIQVLGHIAVAGYVYIIDIGGTGYPISGPKTEEIKNYDGRKLLVTARPSESDIINEIEVLDYEVIPYSVLTGKLGIKRLTWGGVTTDWLILNTSVGGKEYIFRLKGRTGEITKYLRNNYVRKEVTVAGVFTSPMAHTLRQTFVVSYICE